jgi:iron only hydrogenase large subunit-like protein
LEKYYHSVTLDKEKCRGCTNCIKRCPTEAIRVRDGKARIIGERCIDCGECIRVCPYHAKVALTDPLDSIYEFPYRIALPAPTLYGQFKNTDITAILIGLKELGFDDVFEVARGADYVSAFVKEAMKDKERKKPAISSACPAIVRLIQVRFPELIDNIINIESPMEIAARLAKKEFSRKKGVKEEDIGAFFITPCAAKMTSIRNPIGIERSWVDGAISILEIYGPLYNKIANLKNDEDLLQTASPYGILWANSGGESSSLGVDNYLAVDGIQNVIRVLEEIEDDKLTDLEFFEGLACSGGCVGGPLVFENGFVAKNRIRKLAEKAKGEDLSTEEVMYTKEKIQWYFEKEILPKPVMKLDDDITLAMKKMEAIERIYEGLPGLDCGSCGSPSCRTHAEDIVRGYASEMDCVFKLREKVKELAQQMIEISEKIPGGKTNNNE